VVWLVRNGHPSLDPYTSSVQTWFEDQGVMIQQVAFPRYIEVTKYRLRE
jgi:hypothetical protein